MELGTALEVLGVSATDEWVVVRNAYRARIRAVHPDIAGPEGAERSIRLNTAYRTLSLARRDGTLSAAAERAAAPERPAPRRPPSRPSRPVADDIRIAGGDTLILSSTPAETFRRLVEATNQLGEISYVDRSSAIFEAVLVLEDGHHASFVVSLQWRAHDATCEAFCTLEALDRAEHLDVSGVLEQLVPFIPADCDRP